MNVLIVTAHPAEHSLCHTLARFVSDTLAAQGHHLAIDNLYQSGFDPVLSPEERSRYYRQPYDTSAIGKEVDRLQAAELLVLIFPTWWFGFPAILKGWFDRVWAPTVAYDHATDFGPIRPRLDNLRQALVITTLGAPWWVDYFVLWRPVKRVIQFALLGACARKCRLKYISFYHCENIDSNRIEQFKKKIGSTLARLG